MFDLKGHTALVTGAGQGVGRGIALSLAKQGAAVVVNSFHLEKAESTAQEILKAGGRAVAVQGDVTDLESVRKMVEAGRAAFGCIDILVNNVGNAGADGMMPTQFREIRVEEFDSFIKANIYGVVNCSKVLIDDMCDRGWGRIITISSESYRDGNGMGLSAYGAGKGGGVGFSVNLASEVGRYGVTVNVVSISFMEGNPFAEAMVWTQAIPRVCKAADVGAAVGYLASEEASFITGVVIPVNGASLAL